VAAVVMRDTVTDTSHPVPENEEKQRCAVS
jgi:hypothetical protein